MLCAFNLKDYAKNIVFRDCQIHLNVPVKVFLITMLYMYMHNVFVYVYTEIRNQNEDVLYTLWA